MLMRRAEAANVTAMAEAPMPTIRDGSSYPLAPERTEAQALARRMGQDAETLVAAPLVEQGHSARDRD